MRKRKNWVGCRRLSRESCFRRWRRCWQPLKGGAQREVLPALGERVVPVRVGRGTYAVQIAWTPLGEGLREAVVAPTPSNQRTAA